MFRTVTIEVRLVRAVVAGVKAFAEMMAEAFLRRVAQYLEDDEELPVGVLALLQRIVARMIDGARRRLEDKERAHLDALRAEGLVRIRRDREADYLYQVLLKARKTFEAFGRGMSSRYVGLDPGLGASDPQLLLRYGYDTLGVLRNPGFQAPDVKELSPDTLSPQEHVAEIQPAVEALEATVDELEVKKRLTEAALKEKTQALEEHKETFTYGSRFCESLYVLAGERFHASRLRPTVGRGGAASPLPEPDEVPGDEEALPSEPPADDEPSPSPDPGPVV